MLLLFLRCHKNNYHHSYIALVMCCTIKHVINNSIPILLVAKSIQKLSLEIHTIKTHMQDLFSTLYLQNYDIPAEGCNFHWAFMLNHAVCPSLDRPRHKHLQSLKNCMPPYCVLGSYPWRMELQSPPLIYCPDSPSLCRVLFGTVFPCLGLAVCLQAASLKQSPPLSASYRSSPYSFLEFFTNMGKLFLALKQWTFYLVLTSSDRLVNKLLMQ